jgi:hypothetical protein
MLENSSKNIPNDGGVKFSQLFCRRTQSIVVGQLMQRDFEPLRKLLNKH